MITANNPDAKYMMIVIKNLQSLGTSSCREAGLNINLSQTSNLKVSPPHPLTKGLYLCGSSNLLHNDHT